MKNILICWVSTVLFVPVLAFGQSSSTDLKLYTKDLTKIDKVEIFEVAGNPETESIQKILRSKTLSSTESEAILKLWKGLDWKFEKRATCHNPNYAVKFFSKDKLKLYASICWMCGNIRILSPIDEETDFNTKSNESEFLLKAMVDFFPK